MRLKVKQGHGNARINRWYVLVRMKCHIDVAIREAKEEGDIELKSESIKLIMKYFSSPGGTSECIYLYWSTFDSSKVISGSVHGLPHENEDIMLHLVSRNDALALLSNGKISNAATIIGLQWLAINYQNL